MSNTFWSRIVGTLEPYVPGEQPKIDGLIKLNTNENPYGPSPKVLEAIRREAGDRLRLYPDPNSDHLKKAIAEFYGIDMDMVFVGNGSDEVLAHAFAALLKKDAPLLFPDITYSFYPVYCRLYDIDYEEVPLDEQFCIDVDMYARKNGGIIFANPNAPTGRPLALSEIERLLEMNRDSVVVVDEAYIDFGGDSAVGLTRKYDNLLVIQTLSKSRSLAGLRIGFAVGERGLIEGLERVKNSFNSYPLDRLAIVGGAAAMADRDYFEKTCSRIITTRERITKGLRARGFEVLPSSANFVFASLERTKGKMDAAEMMQQLRVRKILVRHFNGPRVSRFLRITVGTEEHCDVLLQAVDEVLG